MYRPGLLDLYRWMNGFFGNIGGIPTSSIPFQEDASNFSLTGTRLERHGAASNYLRLLTPVFEGRTNFIVDEKSGVTPCGTIRSFGFQGGILTQSLNNATYPGRFEFLSNREDMQNSIYAVSLFNSACQIGGSVQLLTQQGTSLVPKNSPVTLSVSPASLTFTAIANGSNPPVQTLQIASSGAPLSLTVTDNTPWLSVSPASATTPATLQAFVNITGLAAGTYTAAITITAAGAANSPVNVPVTLTVQDGQSLVVNPAMLTFQAVSGGASPAPHRFQLQAPVARSALR